LSEPGPTFSNDTRPRANLGLPRAARLVLVSLAVTLVWVLAMLVPNLVGFIPYEIQIVLFHPLSRVATMAALLTIPLRSVAVAVPRRLAERAQGSPLIGAVPVWAARVRELLASLALRRPRILDRPSEWIVSVPLTLGVAAACLLLLLSWVPHYLTWPWWVDTDQFAASALCWEAGVHPYGDLADFDFPGPIYAFYLLGKAVGWGHTVPYNALDASLLMLLGAALVAWSRRVFGGALPGLIGYLTFLGFYLGLDYSRVAQRDWHGPWFVVMGLLAMELWPGRASRLGAALAMAAAIAYRPHEVLYLPAMASAVMELPASEASWPRRLRPLAEWALALAISLLMVFSPLILAGVFDDFLRALQLTRYGGNYNKTTWLTFVDALNERFIDHWTTRLLAVDILLAVLGPPALRRPARTWGLAMLGTMFYRPISPDPRHSYLDQPLMLMRSINLALPMAWILTAPVLVAPLRLATVAALLMAVAPEVPRFCSITRSFRAIGTLVRGEDPPEPPPGCAEMFLKASQNYPWGDYCRLVAYLRTSTPQRTRVANFLRAMPFPTVNGPAGRATPYPAAGGFVHLWNVDPGLEGRFVETLEQATDTVVVWIPDEPNVLSVFKLPSLERVIRRCYHLEARFGKIEVWRVGTMLPHSLSDALCSSSSFRSCIAKIKSPPIISPRWMDFVALSSQP
jgi:hypothetical protein